MIITHKLQPMDLTHKQNTIRVDVVQDDKYSRDIEFTLTENGVAWQIPDGTTAIVRYKKPDGTGGNYDTLPDGSTAYQINGNVLTVALAPQVCTVQGHVQLSVGIIHGNAEINTFSVNIVVHPNPGAEYQSEDYIKLSGAVPNSGWTPNMYLGTDASGNVVAKEGTSGGGGGIASGDYIPVPPTAEVGQTIVVKAVDENGKPTEWEAANMPSGGGGVEIDISRQPDLILEVSESVVSLSISEINGEPIDTTEMAVLWEHPGGAQYIPNYFRFNNEVKNSTVTDTALANFNLPANICPSNTTAAAILCRVKKINNGTYWCEFSGLQQNVGTIAGAIQAVYGAPYRNNLIGETSIKEFYVYQASNIQEGCKVSVWVK